MTGFVAMGILSDQAGDITGYIVALQCRRHCEKRIQAGSQPFLSAHQSRQPFHIVRNKERPLPGIPLAIIILTMRRCQRSKRCTPFTLFCLSPDKANISIKYIFIIERLFIEISGLFASSYLFGKTCQRPIVESIFECAGHRFHFHITRDVTVFPIIFQSDEIPHRIPACILHRRFGHCFESQFRIETDNTVQISIGNYGKRMYSGHLIILNAPQRPDRQLSGIFVMLQQRFYIVFGHLRMKHRKKRAGRPERIPKTDDSPVIIEPVRLMDLPIRSPETMIHIRK